MATLVLTAVGSLVGGPVGGAIGAIVGQQIDQRLLAPRGRRGPRLNELAVQGSTYGAPIPKLFGRTRVAGSVVWATDLKETRRKVSGGKGQPKQTVYSYSASFAVALSSRAAGSIGRIWADGKLLRGAAGDFKVQTSFRFWTGSEDQPVDPLIGAAQGGAGAPAYRGIALAVFEDLQLAEFGNRIPSLSFEVLAEASPVAIGAICAELGGGTVAADAPTVLEGLAATGDSLRGLIETLSAAVPLYLRDDGTRLRLVETPETRASPLAREFGARRAGQSGPAKEAVRERGALQPAACSIVHYDPDRDYQQGVQRAHREQAGRGELRIELPVTLAATQARALAERAMAVRQAESRRLKIDLPPRHLRLEPATAIAVPGESGLWRIERLALEQGALRAALVRQTGFGGATLAADAGGAVKQADAPHGPTSLVLAELPRLDPGLAQAPLVVAAAAGTSPGWRSAVLLASLDGGASWIEAGGTAAPAILGRALGVLQPGPATLFDRAGAVDVELLNANMELADATPDRLLAGANLALLGVELIQFGRAIPLGGRRWRLSGLLRGRRGTEWAIATHAPDERFLLIEREALAALDVPAGAASVGVIAAGIGDPPEGVRVDLAVAGEALRPPSPVHTRIETPAGLDWRAYWVRRSRDGWQWLDGTETPLGEEAERYRVTMSLGAAERVAEVAAPEWIYPASQRQQDIAGGATHAEIAIAQIGTAALSRPARISILLTP